MFDNFKRKLRIITVMFTAVMLAVLCCGCMSEEAKQVQDLIEDIGVVTLESGEEIAVAEASYASLTDRDKSAIRNYDTLTAAREKYDDLTNRKAFSEVSEEVESLIAQKHNLKSLLESDYDLKTIKCSFYTNNTMEAIEGDVKYNLRSLYEKSESIYLATLEEVVHMCRKNGLMDIDVTADVYLADGETILLSFDGVTQTTTQNLFQTLHDEKLAAIETREDCVFRNLRWGDTSDDVYKNETAEVIEAASNGVVFSVEFANYLNDYYVQFDENQVVSAVVISCQTTFSGSNCFGCYDTYKKELSAMFGAPLSDDKITTNRLANYTDDIGALTLGYERYLASWETETTEIKLAMVAQSMGKIGVAVRLLPK